MGITFEVWAILPCERDASLNFEFSSTLCFSFEAEIYLVQLVLELLYRVHYQNVPPLSSLLNCETRTFVISPMLPLTPGRSSPSTSQIHLIIHLQSLLKVSFPVMPTKDLTTRRPLEC